MPVYVRAITAFVGGEQSPSVQSRTDIEQYKFGCRKLRNVTLLPQGGVVRRAGAKLMQKLSGLIEGKAFKMVGFTRNSQQKYLLVFSEGKIEFFRAGIKVHEIASADITSDSIASINEAQLADTMIIASKAFKPKQLRWQGSDSDWSLSDVVFDFIPDYSFNDAQSPEGEAEIQNIFLKQTGLGSTFNLALEGFETGDIGVDSDWNVTAERIQEELRRLSITPSTGIEVEAVGYDPVNPQYSNLQFKVTFDGAAADNWGTISGAFRYRPDRANEYIYATVQQEGQGRSEPVWSETRGFPSLCAFFENRLILANSSSLKQSLWCSVIGNYFDFNEGSGLDSDAINRTIATAKNNEIVALVSSRELQVLTANSEHYNPYAMTPSTFGMPAQTTNGSKEIRAQLINGATYFIQRLGNGVRQFVYTDAESSYSSTNIALLSEHLIKDVKETAQLQGVETDADYLYCLNNNGTVAVMNILRAQNVQSWSLWETSAGEFYSIGNVEEELYTIIKAKDGYYLCLMTSEVATDLAQEYQNVSEINLENAGAYSSMLSAITDNMYAGEFLPDEPIELIREYDHVEVGVNFIPKIIPNYISDEVTNGTNRNRMKRPIRAWVELHNAVGVDLIYNKRTYKIAYREMPVMFADPSPKPFTGSKEKRLTGFTKDTTVEIRQTLPFKKTAILALQLELRTV